MSLGISVVLIPSLPLRVLTLMKSA